MTHAWTSVDWELEWGLPGPQSVWYDQVLKQESESEIGKWCLCVWYFLCFRIQGRGGQASRPEKQDALDLSATFSPTTPGAPGKQGRCGRHCCSTLHTKCHLQHNINPQGSLENSAEKNRWLLSPDWTVWVTNTCILESTKWASPLGCEVRAGRTRTAGSLWRAECSTPDPT